MPKRNNRINTRPWKQGGGWTGEEPGRYYYEHDDRTGDNTRRVSFMSKNRISKHSSRKRETEIQIHGRVNEDDIEMVGTSYASKSNRYKGYNSKVGGAGPSGGSGGGGGRDGRYSGRGSRGGRHVHIAGPSFPHPMSEGVRWFKITVPYGGKYSKDYILKTLLNFVSPVTFIPLGYRVTNQEASFYVDDSKAASTLSRANKKITTSDGFKLMIRASPGVPNITADVHLKQKIKEAMQSRYNAGTKALDLTKFHTHPLLASDTLVAMFRPAMLTVIVDLVADNIPELVGLNLNENQLFNLDPLAILAKRTPNLAVLHLGNNKIRDIHKLDCLKGMKLVELFLDGNPLCDRFREEGAYVSAVRKRFPKVLRLDGEELPPPINFDVAEEVRLPAVRASFMCSPEGAAVARQFLEQYYAIYDSENRQPLVDAYHDSALFSMTMSMPRGDTNHRLGHYVNESRNLMRVRDAPRRLKLLNSGKAAVVAKLGQMPLTRHDLASFAVDMPIFNAQMMLLCVTGLFVEPKLNNMPVRFFSRLFVIVPQGAGFVIINDMMNITNATEKQSKAVFTKPLPEPSGVPAPISTPTVTPVASPVTSPSVAPSVPVVPDEVKEQMLVALSQQTGMNLVWSKKCLEENHWDFQAALTIFNQLSSEQKVPPEAFVQ